MDKQCAVWRYVVPSEVFTLRLPRGAQVLSVVVPHSGTVYLYVLVEPGNPVEPRHFTTLATGEYIPSRQLVEFIGTFQPEPGLWFHLFEVQEGKE